MVWSLIYCLIDLEISHVQTNSKGHTRVFEVVLFSGVNIGTFWHWHGIASTQPEVSK